jgi:hypothetical protein
LLLAFSSLPAPPASAQVVFDHQDCFRIRDLRNIPPNVPVTLTPFQSSQFFASTGCQLLPLRRPQAKELCVMADKNPSSPPVGPNLQVDYLCYRARCGAGPNLQSTHNATDQFGSGQVRAIQRGRIRKVCVPAILPGLPTPTPSPAPCPTPTPTPPPYGSASQAFVAWVKSLLH